jgi:hypothetical protein
MNLIWKIKIFFDKISNNSTSIKSDIDKIYSDIIYYQEQSFHYKIIYVF